MMPALGPKETLAGQLNRLEIVVQELAVSDFPEKLIKEAVKLNIE